MEGTRLQNPKEVQGEARRLKKELPMEESRRRPQNRAKTLSPITDIGFRARV